MEMKIIIQQTENGLQVVYPNNFDDYSVENKKYMPFLIDEAHKADYTDAYSVKIKDQLKTYSLISSDIKDTKGRSGSFFAVRVIVSKNKNIEEIHSLLNNIKERYVEHYHKSALATLAFSDLTDAVNEQMPITNNLDTIVSGSAQDAFLFKNNTVSLTTLLNDTKICLVNSLYVFDKEKTEKVIYERMIDFNEVTSKSRKIQFTTNGLLQALVIDGEELQKPYPFDFELLTLSNKNIKYKNREEKEFKEVSSFEDKIVLQHKHVTPPKPPRQRTTKPPKTPLSTILTYSFLVIGIISILGWLIWDSFQPNIPNNQDNMYTTAPRIIDNSTSVEEKSILIQFKEEIVDNEKEYSIVNPTTLKDFAFKYASKKWSYKNAKKSNTYVDFNTDHISDIYKSVNEVFNDTIKKDFIKALEDISKHEIANKQIENKEAPVKKSPVTPKQSTEKKPTEVKKKESEKKGQPKEGVKIDI